MTQDKRTLPKISVVTANRNGGKFIEATIRSVVEQGYPSLQYVVVDGNSTDESPQIIERYADKISVMIREPDEGHGDALNKGFGRTDGEIMAWLNSDDMYLPWTFSLVAEIFQTFPEVMWIEGIPTLWDEAGRMIGVMNTRPINKFDYLIGRYKWIQQESVFWRRSLWEQAGGYIDASFQLMPDGELWSRFFRHAKLHRVDTILAGFRIHATNQSRDLEGVQKVMDSLIDRVRAASSSKELAVARRIMSVERFFSPFPRGVADLAVKIGMRRRMMDIGYLHLSADGDRWHTHLRSFR